MRLVGPVIDEHFLAKPNSILVWLPLTGHLPANSSKRSMARQECLALEFINRCANALSHVGVQPAKLAFRTAREFNAVH